MSGPRRFSKLSRHPEDNLLSDPLNGSGQVLMPLGQRLVLLSGRASKQFGKPVGSHSETDLIVEIVHIQRKSPIRIEVDQFLQDEVSKDGTSIRCKTHDFVLVRINSEAEIIGEC